ncbi:MAG: hypothetical protein LBC20_09220 [Planctomycetaceae bacterium]|jgi:hypothetical protein|nr:hypothetical protein [Planctomycetaceae bacterium]
MTQINADDFSAKLCEICGLKIDNLAIESILLNFKILVSLRLEEDKDLM